jgi:hypothetical protein
MYYILSLYDVLQWQSLRRGYLFSHLVRMCVAKTELIVELKMHSSSVPLLEAETTAELFKRVNHAYSILSDPESRALVCVCICVCLFLWLRVF